mgnify:CR=1 FL=1
MKNKFRKNRRGEIPITILVLGVIAICGLALLSFVITNSETNAKLQSVAVMKKINCEIEKYEFYKNKFDVEKAKELIDAKDIGLGEQIFARVGSVEVSYNLD